MDLTDMTFEERYAMMRKRHAFLHEIATQYSSLEAFASERDEWFAVRGIELTFCEKYISLYIQLDYTEYEEYYVIPGKDGHLTISEVIMWQDECCANTYLNIFDLSYPDEEDILTSIHDYSYPVSRNDTRND